jgi:hypothetical protein
VLLGSNMSVRVPDRSLRLAFGVILSLSGLRLLEVPHANAMIAVAAVAAAVGLALWTLRRLVLARRATPAVE